MAVASKRGKITEFSDNSQRRLKRKLEEFVSATDQGRRMAVTLTTGLCDVRKAKLKLKLWADNMRHAHDFAGVYAVEFNRAGGVHFHMHLRFFCDMGTEELRRDCFRRWRRFNPSFCPNAGDFKPADDAEGWNTYIAKRNEQKALRGLINGEGMGGTWWGVMGKKFFNGMPSARSAEGSSDKIDDDLNKAAGFLSAEGLPDTAEAWISDGLIPESVSSVAIEQSRKVEGSEYEDNE